MYKKNHNAKTCDPPLKIIKVPLLFKAKDLLSPKSVTTQHTWHAQSTDRKSQTTTRQIRNMTPRNKEQPTSVRKAAAKAKVDVRNQKQNSRSKMNKVPSSSIKKTPSYTKKIKNEQSSILVNQSIDKPSQAKRPTKGITDFKEIEHDEISTERSIDTLPNNDVYDLRERFIRKRSQVYQVLCNLDCKFDDIKRREDMGMEMVRNTPMSSKKDIMNMIDRRVHARR